MTVAGICDSSTSWKWKQIPSPGEQPGFTGEYLRSKARPSKKEKEGRQWEDSVPCQMPFPWHQEMGHFILHCLFNLVRAQWCQRLDEVRTTDSLELNRSCSRWGCWVILRKAMRWWGEFSRNQLKMWCVFEPWCTHSVCTRPEKGIRSLGAVFAVPASGKITR